VYECMAALVAEYTALVARGTYARIDVLLTMWARGWRFR
jgi:hypothetical protein